MTDTCARCSRILELVGDLIPAETLEVGDDVDDFLDSRTAHDPQAVVLAANLYSAYVHWSVAAGRYTLSGNGFARELSRRGFAACRGSGGRRARRGLALLNPDRSRVEQPGRSTPVNPFIGEMSDAEIAAAREFLNSYDVNARA